MKNLKVYLKSREKAINQVLNKPRKSYTSGTFHNLRVEIKKLSALFELINYCAKDFQRNKTFNPFKLIFKHAGNVREIQVEEMMLKKYFINNLIIGYRNSLKKIRLKEQEDYFSILNKKFLEKLKRKQRKIVPFLSQVTKKRVRSYMDWKKGKIEEFLNKNRLNLSDAHKLRIQLKTFNYNLKILNLQEQNKSTKKKDSLTNILGKWHDRQVTLINLKKAIVSNKISIIEANQLKKIKEKIASDSKKLFHEITSTISQNKISLD